MGSVGSHISTSDDTSSTGSTSSTFEMMRQLSYESDVFYADTTSQPNPMMPDEKPALPKLTPEKYPIWKNEEMNPGLLRFMKRSYNPSPETFKISAKKLAELCAAQQIPAFVSSFNGTQCIKLHWACHAGWCMCKYQYQPMTPIHLMPHTRITSSNVRKNIPVDSEGNSNASSDDVTTNMTSSKTELDKTEENSSKNNNNDITTLHKKVSTDELYNDEIRSDENDGDVTNNDVLNVIRKESTV